jgi:hypothetical protein
LGDQGPGDGNALALTTAKIGAVFTDQAVVTFGQFKNEFVRARFF